MKVIKVLLTIVFSICLFTQNLKAEIESNVNGIVQYENGTPASGLFVKAFHKNLRNLILLGETTTDSNGYYSIDYFYDGEVDLVIRIYSLNYGLVYQSTPLFNAQTEETVDITLLSQELKRIIDRVLPRAKVIVPLKAISPKFQDLHQTW